MLAVQKLGFYTVQPDEPVTAVLRQAGRDYWVLVFFEIQNEYAILKKADLQEVARQLGGRGMTLDYEPIGRLAQRLAQPGIALEMDEAEARQQAQAAAYTCRVALDAAGKVAGLFFADARRAQPMRPDAEMVELMVNRLTQVPKMASSSPPEDAPKEMGLDDAAPANIAPELAFPNTSRPPDSQPPPEDAGRKVYVTLKDEQERFYDAARKPLQLQQTYKLGFDVDQVGRTEEVLAAADFEDKKVFRGEDQPVKLVVRLSSADFDIQPAEQEMEVPRRGRSQRIWFEIAPQHEGAGVISAVFTKDNNFIQSMTLHFHTGALMSVETTARALGQAFIVPQRDLNLTILNQGNGTYSFMLTGAVAATATLSVTPALLDSWIGGLRKSLLEIVETMADGAWVYQEGIDIPAAVHEASALRLATEGWRLYNNLFFGAGADAMTKLMGEKLRLLTEQGALNIQVFSKDFVLPWSALYLAERRPRTLAELDPQKFLGMRHVIEHIPLQQDMNVLDSDIRPTPLPMVGLFMNEDIDGEVGQPVVAGQIAEWEALQQAGKVQLQVRRKRGEVKDALEFAEETHDQIMYFYCHAVSRSLSEADGPDTSLLKLSGGGSLTLEELKDTMNFKLPGNPLVFLNACESAELSPLFYDGFVQYFMSKGARGVIGTECKIPALFARAWAARFFERFLAGERLGEIVLGLRQEFYQQHNNLLGLLYALYVDGDTRLKA